MSRDRDVHPEAAGVYANLSLSQVLVETDAPRLPFWRRGQKVPGAMTPWSTFTIFRWLAGVRQVIGKEDKFGDCIRDVGAAFSEFFSVQLPRVR